MEQGFEIKLPQFEGPFDLLLFFIERDELDIYNIPIYKITNDFFEFLNQMSELNMEVASEFILVASSLMRIKAKMLLPRPELDEQGQEVDPRKDLVEQLLQYKKFKAAAEEFKLLEEDMFLREKRGNIVKELTGIAQNSSYADELNSLSLFKLLETFQKVAERFSKESHKPKHTVIQYAYSIEGQKDYVVGKLRDIDNFSFSEFLAECKDRYHLIFTFMAILELLQEQLIAVKVGLGFNNFWITPKASEQ